jgi:hypothetical protein
MFKQLSLFDQDEWWMKVFNTIPDQKKAETVVAIKALFIAEFERKSNKGECHGKRKNQRSSFIKDRICLCETIDPISSEP